ncbi:hypothetical protein BBJ28_00014929 [Nothophytophthora sp. Chile5]|nr:hypothetical protein BBJ28_00014929 [Nothophytophthora sp. Chile5]
MLRLRAFGLHHLRHEILTEKTANLLKLAEHIRFILQHASDLLSFFLHPFFRKLKFRRFTLKTKQLDRACNELMGALGTKTVIGFGDSGAAGSNFITRCPAGPVKAVARKLARRCEVVVVVVDEHHTSQVHHDCNIAGDLVNQRTRRVCQDGVRRSVAAYIVLYCLTMKSGCGKTVDRDATQQRASSECSRAGSREKPSAQTDFNADRARPKNMTQQLARLPNGW